MKIPKKTFQEIQNTFEKQISSIIAHIAGHIAHIVVQMF